MISSKEKKEAGKRNEKNDADFDKITRKGFSEELALEERPEKGEEAAMQSRSISGQRNSRGRGPRGWGVGESMPRVRNSKQASDAAAIRGQGEQK